MRRRRHLAVLALTIIGIGSLMVGCASKEAERTEPSPSARLLKMVRESCERAPAVSWDWIRRDIARKAKDLIAATGPRAFEDAELWYKQDSGPCRLAVKPGALEVDVPLGPVWTLIPVYLEGELLSVQVRSR